MDENTLTVNRINELKQEIERLEDDMSKISDYAYFEAERFFDGAILPLMIELEVLEGQLEN